MAAGHYQRAPVQTQQRALVDEEPALAREAAAVAR